MIKDIENDEDYRQLILASSERPVFLIKHSTTCPISKGAWKRFMAFAEEESTAEYCRVLILENWNLSQKIAEDTEIDHQSPQVILFHGGRAVWKSSHRAITAENMGHQLKRIVE